jgi:hypothetical protein
MVFQKVKDQKVKDKHFILPVSFRNERLSRLGVFGDGSRR